MSDETAAVTAATPKKEAKWPAKKREKVRYYQKPKFAEKVADAITSLNERDGSSLKAIKNHLGADYRKTRVIYKYLKYAVGIGSLVQTEGKGAIAFFKLSAGQKTKEDVSVSGGGGEKKSFNCRGDGHISRNCPSEIVCYQCNKVGHKTRNCPDARKRGCESYTRCVCFKCNKLGHKARHCPNVEDGGGKRCFKCGEEDHSIDMCPIKRFCFKCNKEGHSNQHCPDVKSTSICYRCNELGHKAGRCPNAKDGTSMSNIDPAKPRRIQSQEEAKPERIQKDEGRNRLINELLRKTMLSRHGSRI